MALEKIISVLKDAEKILILPHVSADGDCLGSALALGFALEKMGKTAKILLEEEIPYIYRFLPGSDKAEIYNGQACQYNVVVALDTGDRERLGKRIEIFDKADITVNIDHHTTNTMFALHNYVDTQASAVGEIVYQVIDMMGLDIDSTIATCIYVAITTDTGGFRFSNTSSTTHLIISQIISAGADVSDISQKVFETTSLEKVKLMGAAVSTLEIMEDGKLAVITITDEMIKNAGAVEEDCDGLVNLGRNIRGVEAAILLRQKGENEVKVNFRSKNYVDVSSIAAKFSGGGHKRAAGCTVNGDIEDVRNKIIKDIREALKTKNEWDN